MLLVVEKNPRAINCRGRRVKEGGKVPSGKSRQVMIRCVVEDSSIESSVFNLLWMYFLTLIITLSLFIWIGWNSFYPSNYFLGDALSSTFGWFVEKRWRRMNFGGGAEGGRWWSNPNMPFLPGSSVFLLAPEFLPLPPNPQPHPHPAETTPVTQHTEDAPL